MFFSLHFILSSVIWVPDGVIILCSLIRCLQQWQLGLKYELGYEMAFLNSPFCSECAVCFSCRSILLAFDITFESVYIVTFGAFHSYM